MLEVNIRVRPGERFGVTIADLFVPAEVADGPRVVKSPVIPLPMFGGVRERGIKDDAHNSLAACVFDSHAYSRRTEVNELHGTRGGSCRIGRRGLRRGKRGVQERGYRKKEKLPCDFAGQESKTVGREIETGHGDYPPKMGRRVELAGYKGHDQG